MAKPVIKASLVGAETIVIDLRRLDATLRRRLREEVGAIAQELASKAMMLAPVKTGALRASIYAAGKETEKRTIAAIGTDIKNGMAFYGRFLESGWTPNNRTKLVNVGAIFGPSGPSVVSMRKAGWKRNPRNERAWARHLGAGGKRKIYAYPFLKPALASMRNTIRQRMLAVVQSAR